MTDHNRRAEDGRIDLILTSVQDIKKSVDGVTECLNGNGKPGIKIRLDRVEQRNKGWDWVLKAIGLVVIGLSLKEVWALFNP